MTPARRPHAVASGCHPGGPMCWRPRRWSRPLAKATRGPGSRVATASERQTGLDHAADLVGSHAGGPKGITGGRAIEMDV